MKLHLAHRTHRREGPLVELGYAGEEQIPLLFLPARASAEDVNYVEAWLKAVRQHDRVDHVMGQTTSSERGQW